MWPLPQLLLPHSSRFQGVFYPNPSKLMLPLLLSLPHAGSRDISVGLEELSTSNLPGAQPALLEAGRAGNVLGAKGSPAPGALLLRLFQFGFITLQESWERSWERSHPTHF